MLKLLNLLASLATLGVAAQVLLRLSRHDADRDELRRLTAELRQSNRELAGGVEAGGGFPKSTPETHAMSPELETLKGEVERVKTVDQAAITLIKGLGDKLAANAGDPEAIQAIAADLKSQSDDFAAAITANTPADPNAGGGSPPQQTHGHGQAQAQARKKHK